MPWIATLSLRFSRTSMDKFGCILHVVGFSRRAQTRCIRERKGTLFNFSRRTLPTKKETGEKGHLAEGPSNRVPVASLIRSFEPMHQAALCKSFSSAVTFCSEETLACLEFASSRRELATGKNSRMREREKERNKERNKERKSERKKERKKRKKEGRKEGKKERKKGKKDNRESEGEREKRKTITIKHKK